MLGPTLAGLLDVRSEKERIRFPETLCLPPQPGSEWFSTGPTRARLVEKMGENSFRLNRYSIVTESTATRGPITEEVSPVRRVSTVYAHCGARREEWGAVQAAVGSLPRRS